MINEKGLCAAMKSAWRNGGYEVAGYGENNMIFINGYGWCAAAPQRQLSRRALALLVEHVGQIPTAEAFRVQKNTGAQGVLMDMALEAKDTISRLLSEENAAEIRQSAMTWKGWQVWQKTDDQQVMAYDGALVAIGEGDPELYGNMLVWDEGGELAVVLPGSNVLDNALREVLEQTILVGE